jgi:hypothetical protein
MAGNKGQDFVLPIIIYVDKTGTDANQRHSLEPVLFTLGIFKRKIRNQTRAWRILGFVPDMEQKSSAVKAAARSGDSKGLSTRNYHKCLRVVLQSFVDAQQESHQVYLRIGNWVKCTQPRLPIAFISGDAKSGDMLCGRFGGHNTKRMARACNVSMPECEDHLVQCEWVASSKFEEYSALASEKFDAEKFKLLHGLQNTKVSLSTAEKEAKKAMAEQRKKYSKLLHSYSQHRHLSAFTGVDFGANLHGICGATPSDLMHAFLEGVLKYILGIIIHPMAPTSKRDLDFVIDAALGKFRSSEMYNFQLRSNYTHGFTNLTMLTADEWAGMAFTLLVISLFQRGQKALST